MKLFKADQSIETKLSINEYSETLVQHHFFWGKLYWKKMYVPSI